jgi:hypothetical protein
MPRAEVREGRSFNPDEFAIALEQVVAGTAPADYRDAQKFFSRTYFTKALIEHAGMVLRRLSGETENTAPVLTLVTQFGGGKTHTLTALYHLVKHGADASADEGVQRLMRESRLRQLPGASVAVFVGNAWDPQPGKETPWLDVARQLAGDAGVRALGAQAATIPPGTESLGRLFAAAGGPVLVLFDEVLNFVNRYRGQADSFYAFIQNLTVAVTGCTNAAAVISLPRSQVEMTEHDVEWQTRITKVVRRVAKDLMANDESEISEVVRRRLFEDLGRETARRAVARAYADWCFERRAQLQPEWTAVDSASTEARAREALRARFEACYPFHPATLTVFQRKWQALPQYQQTRGTLAMLAQWISWAFRESHQRARREPLITLGSAPLSVPEFRATVLGQLGEPRLEAAIMADVAGANSRSTGLDADARGALREIHRRVGTTIFFESSGGMTDRYAHLPELRFALGEPDVDTTTIDNAAVALEEKGFYLRKAGTDGFRFGFQPTLKKVVSDRRASLDASPGGEVDRAVKDAVKTEFERGASVPLLFFPDDPSAIADTPRLTLVVLDPATEWDNAGTLRGQLASWTRERGQSARLYPGALLWCIRKPGRGLRDKTELALAWKRVAREIEDGTIGGDFEQSDRASVASSVRDAGDDVKDEVWADYRFILLADPREESGLKLIDLGAGHASAGETLTARVITALKSEGLLNDSVGAGYLERSWPEALRASGAWPLQGLRQSFVNGALTRLRDPESILRTQIATFVASGEFGLASGQHRDGTYDRVWFNQPIGTEEVTFEPDVYLLKKERAAQLRAPAPTPTPQPDGGGVTVGPEVGPGGAETIGPETVPPVAGTSRLRLSGPIPPELWNRLGTRLLPKLRSGQSLQLSIEAVVEVAAADSENLRREVEQSLADLGIADAVRIDTDQG